MADVLTLSIDGRSVQVPAETTVAAAIITADHAVFRQSVSGQARGPLCGMGICFECRVVINGQGHQRSCQIRCREGMEVRTDG